MKNILLVEDDPFLIDIYTTKLNNSGFSIDVAADGEIGLEKLRGKSYDLVILDIVLPHLNGWEVLEAINQDDKLKDLRIFVLSNLGQKEEVEKGLSMGAIKYFIKAHYTPSEVVNEIKKVLG